MYDSLLTLAEVELYVVLQMVVYAADQVEVHWVVHGLVHVVVHVVVHVMSHEEDHMVD